MALFGIGPSRPRKNEIIAHEWTALRGLWDGVKADTAITEEQKVAIQTLLDTSTGDATWTSSADDWNRLNDAELRIGGLLKGATLIAEYNALVAIARRRKLDDLKRYEDAGMAIFAAAVDTGPGLENQRATYRSLLFTLQSGFINTRFERNLRFETAYRLFWTGLAALALAMLPLLLLWVDLLIKSGDAAAVKLSAGDPVLFSSEPHYALFMAATFGLLGAYFSRLLLFQSRLESIGFVEVMNIYQPRVLITRLLFGMLGSIIFYYILRSGLIGGDAFPKMSQISVIGQLLLEADPANGTLKLKGGNPSLTNIAILAPTSDLAKLLVWSFIAGFSERLVPDTLAQTEARGTSGKP